MTVVTDKASPYHSQALCQAPLAEKVLVLAVVNTTEFSYGGARKKCLCLPCRQASGSQQLCPLLVLKSLLGLASSSKTGMCDEWEGPRTCEWTPLQHPCLVTNLQF